MKGKIVEIFGTIYIIFIDIIYILLRFTFLLLFLKEVKILSVAENFFSEPETPVD